MPRKILSLLIIVLAFMMLVTACERPASKAPVSSTSDNGEAIKTPLPVDQQILNATMTAQAIMKKYEQPTAVTEPPKDATKEPGTVTTEVTGTIAPTAVSTLVQTPTALPPTPVVTKPESYTIHDGEFVYCLARRFDVDPSDLLSLNGLSASSMLSAGMTLKIPTTGSYSGDRALLTHPDTWTVSASETIYKIACAYGDVYPESIIAVNGLVEPYTLEARQVLQIP